MVQRGNYRTIFHPRLFVKRLVGGKGTKRRGFQRGGKTVQRYAGPLWSPRVHHDGKRVWITVSSSHAGGIDRGSVGVTGQG